MSDTPTVPNGAGEGAAAPGIHDEASAMEALRGLLSSEEPPSGQQDSAPQEGADAGSEETPTPGEDEEGQPETPPEAEAPPAAFDPPKSWSAEDVALFQKLPPEAQAVIARRESERDRAYLAKAQEIAGERTAISTERETYQRSVEQLLHLALPELRQYQHIDWQSLSVQNPAEYVRLTEQRNALRQRVDALQGEHGRVQQQIAAEQYRTRAEILAAQKDLLIEKVPEFRDPQKAQKLAADLTTHLAHYGYDPAEVAQAIDHRAILVAQDAMRWRQHVAARAAAERQRTNGQPAPTMQSPGTPPQSNTTERRLKGKFDRLSSTGNVRDAASIIKELL